MIKDSGDRTAFESGAVRDMHEGKGRMDLIPWNVIMRLSKHYENGAKKYEERNWEKGIPSHSFLDSAFRHLAKYSEGWDDEDHLIAAIWNLCGLAYNEEKHPELCDIYNRQCETIAERISKLPLFSTEEQRNEFNAKIFGHNPYQE